MVFQITEVYPSAGTDLGVYAYGLRFYKPQIGKWTSRDPIGEVAVYFNSIKSRNGLFVGRKYIKIIWQLNLYAVNKNNCVMYIDRNGKDTYVWGFSVPTGPLPAGVGSEPTPEYTDSFMGHGAWYGEGWGSGMKIRESSSVPYPERDDPGYRAPVDFPDYLAEKHDVCLKACHSDYIKCDERSSFGKELDLYLCKRKCDDAFYEAEKLDWYDLLTGHVGTGYDLKAKFVFSPVFSPAYRALSLITPAIDSVVSKVVSFLPTW